MAARTSKPTPPSKGSRRRAWRLVFIRLVAGFTCLLGLLGMIGAGFAYRQVAVVRGGVQTELRQTSDTFAQVAVTLTTVSTSSANASVSVGEARVALDDAAKTTRSIADTLDETAKVVNFTVPGTTYKPLAGVDTSFRDQASQLRVVADDVAKTNTALGQNGTDLKAISSDVATVSLQMSDISAQLRRLADDTGGTLSMATDGIRLLILWWLLIHLLLFVMGLCLYFLTVAEPLPTVAATADDQPTAGTSGALDW